MTALPAALTGEAAVCVEIEFGHGRLAEAAALAPGQLVPLLQRAGEPVAVIVNGQLAARGELLVRGGRFCVRLTEVVTDCPPSEAEADGD